MEKVEMKEILDAVAELGTKTEKRLDQLVRAVQTKPKEFSKPIIFSTFDSGLTKTANEMGFKATDPQQGSPGILELPSFNDLMRVMQALEEKDVNSTLCLQVGVVTGTGQYSVEVVLK